jgi:hypothetical protein
VIPDFEPISVDKRSVARDTIKVEGVILETHERTTQRKAQGAISASMSQHSLLGSLSIDANAQAEQQGSQKIKTSEKIQSMVAVQSLTADGEYRWSVSPRYSEKLDGRPWDAAKEPRLKLIDQRKDRSKSLPPIVQVEIRCRREDLVIQDLQIKDESVWESVKSRLGFKNRMAAAESYIRDRLTQERLEVRNIEDAFGQLTLGNVTAQPT